MSGTHPPWLALDAGNTRLKWGIGEASAWLATGSLDAREVQGLPASLPPVPAGTRAVLACVAGPEVERALRQACATLGVPLQLVRASACQLGVRNGYANASQLGGDRWAALVAAHQEQAMNQLVVNAGTALTVDALAADGRFLGGAIAPGVQLMRDALATGTAGLRPAGGRVVPLPGCTDDAIATGTVLAASGLVDRLAGAMGSAGCAPSRIVLGGGGAADIAPWLAIPVVSRAHLVLDGLALIGQSLPWPA